MYTTSDVSAKDVEVLSHEIAEWMNDPLGANIVPSWGDVGQQQQSCSNVLEVGDPLSGTVIPVTLNGFTYHVQELAFFSWFFRQSPSIGAGGLYSSNGSFKTGAGAACR